MGSAIPLSSNPAQLLFFSPFLNVKPRELIAHLCVIINSIKPYGRVRLSNIYTVLLSSQETHLIIKGMVESKFLSLTPKIYSVFYLIWTRPHHSPVTELRLCSVCGIGFSQILREKHAMLTWTQAVELFHWLFLTYRAYLHCSSLSG